MYIPQPSIEFFSIRIDEPITTLTDLFVSAMCFYAFYRLNKIPTRNKMHTYLKVYFMSMGIATTIGGIVGHGFLYLFDYNAALPVSPWKLPGWITSMISIAMIERASIEYARKLIKPKRHRKPTYVPKTHLQRQREAANRRRAELHRQRMQQEQRNRNNKRYQPSRRRNQPSRRRYQAPTKT